MSKQPAIQITDAGRGGTIEFSNDVTTFSLWWEFAGGDAIAIIEAPAPKQWELRTQLPLAQRAEVLTYIAEEVVARKVSSSGYFTIDDNSITVYAGNN